MLDILVVPYRCVSRLGDLQDDELADLFQSVSKIGKVVQTAFGADSLSIAVQVRPLVKFPARCTSRLIPYREQDGKSANQSVPHVHVHIIPRNPTDTYAGSDDFYNRLEENEYGLAGDLADAVQPRIGPMPTLQVPHDDDRKPRTDEEMAREARWLASFF
jgi:bis(5'-adenosyl)-triphosphatase